MASLQKLLNEVSKSVVQEKTQQAERQKRGENFNVFKVLGLQRREVRLHSAFLAELLNPNGDHGLKTLFLESFLTMMIRERESFDFNVNSAEVYVEYYIGPKDGETGGKIDIFITDDKNNAIIIENKIDAGDQENQLKRYYNHVRNNGNNYVLFYLTKDGTEASEYSTGGEPKFEYTCISYRNDIITWLEYCEQLAVRFPLIRETIHQYIINLKEILNIMEDKNTQEILKILLDKSNIETTVSIKEIVSKIAVTIRESFITDRLKPLAKKYNMEFKYDSDFPWLPSGEKSTYKNLRFSLSKYPDIYFTIEQEREVVYYGIGVSNPVNEKLIRQFEDWSDGTAPGWPCGSKYFPGNMKNWDGNEALIDMVKGEQILSIVEKELKRVLENKLIEKLDAAIKKK